MARAAPDRPPRSPGFRAVALVAMAAVSCATVRVPASGIPGTVVVRGDVAEPQVELWVESGSEVAPAEAASAAAEARSALAQAIAGRTLGDGGQLLVVRAQGVSRTGSRKADQTAAAAGIAVAAIAIVAVAVVVLVAAAKGGHGGKAAPSHAAPAPQPRAAPPVAVAPPATAAPAAIPRPAPGGMHAVVPPPARPAPGPSGSGVGFAFGANVDVGVAPGPPPPAVWGDSVVTGTMPPPAGPPAGAEAWELALPPPPPLDVERRGFFAGDSTRLEVTVVDRATLAPAWVKVVESKDDPRDAPAMRALVDRALSDPEGWQPATPPAPPPAAAPAS